MSMFHELMMRKKEQIMYATIKGTLTENDGVFSGFSASNYLEVQDSLDLTKSWEFQITFTTGNDISTEQFILTDTQTPSSIGFGIFTNSQFVAYYMNTQGTRVYTFINGLSANTKYKVNLKYNRDEHKFYVYIDGVQKAAISSIYSLSNRKIRFGVSRTFASAFAGSIDLNNSYIKLGSTKYNLQAVVGYTVVGSPTITDGVVSGFSSANYLQTSQSFDVSQTNWEFVIKASKSSTGNARLFCINNGNGAMHTILSVVTNIFFSCQIGSVTLTINQDFVADTFYYFKIKRNGSMLSLSWSADGVTYQDEQSAEVTNWGNSGYVFYGRVAGLSTAGFGGSIDLNETYIKINNKLWFNGQQA